MKRLLNLFSLLALAALFAGCPGGGGTKPDAGNPDDDGGDNTEEPIIKVSGTASVHPAAAAWLVDGGQAVPSLQGVTLRVEEPLRIGSNENDPLGLFGSQTLTSDGAFSASQVDTSSIIVGVGAGFRDEVDAGFIRSASTIWDVTREGAKPRVDINGAQAYALPKAFVAQLTTAIGATNISTASNGGGSTLEKAGFSFMRVVDASGNPVAGAKLKYRCGVGCVSLSPNQFWYPSADFATASSNTNTSSNGTVVYVGNVNQAHQIIVSVEGNTTYKDHAAGAAPNAGLTVTIKP